MNRDTYDKMLKLRLPGMAALYKEQDNQEGINELTFDERIGLLIDAEEDSQSSHKIERLIHAAILLIQKLQLHKYFITKIGI